MIKIAFTSEFLEAITYVGLESKEEEIYEKICLLESLPELGSKITAHSIKKQYGVNALKLIVDPFVIIYDYFPEVETVLILGLIHQRTII